MHISGVIMAVLVLIAGLGSTVMTAKFIQVRNSWTKKTQAFEANYAKAATGLRTVTVDLNRTRTDLEKTLREWGQTFAGVNTSVTAPAEGRVTVDVGTSSGIADKQVLHGFEVKADGTAVYRGAFQVTTLQADRCALQPTWRVRADDVATWQSGRWRWRTSVPSGYLDLVDKQMVAFGRADETAADRQAQLAKQQRLLADAKAGVARRTAELLGGPELLQDEALAPEFQMGLIPTLESAEEERNQLLVEVDQLRRQIRATRDSVLRLQQENRDLTKKLPQSAASLSSRGL